MNPTNIDYLFKVPTTGSDRAASTNRADDNATGFDNHLSQASASVFDLVRSVNRPSTAANYSSPASLATSHKFSSGANSSRNNADNSPTSRRDRTDSPEQNSSAASSTRDDRTDSARAADKTDDQDRDRDQDQSDDHDLTAAAGAGQTTAKDTSASSNDDSQQGSGDSVDESTLKASAEQAAKEDAKAGADTEGLTTTDTATAGTAAQLTAGSAGGITTGDAANETATSEKPTDEKATTAGDAKRSDIASAKAKAVGGESSTATDKSGDQSTSASSADAATTDSSATTAAGAVATTTANLTNTSNASDNGDTVQNKAAGHDDQDTADANSSASVVAPSSTNAAATAVANIATTTAADTAVDADKLKSGSDQTTKPVTAKAETDVGPLGRALRATTDLTGGSKSSSTSETPVVDPARFVSRVAKAFQTANDRGGTLQLRLNPQELGSLKIQLTVKDGVMNASVEADNANARRLLLDHLPALRDRLADQNIRIDRFDVEVKQEGTGGQTNPRGSNQNPYQQQAEKSEAKRSPTGQTSSAAVAAEVPAVGTRISNTEINLVV